MEEHVALYAHSIAPMTVDRRFRAF